MNLFVCTQGLEDHKMHDVQQRRGKKFDFFCIHNIWMQSKGTKQYITTALPNALALSVIVAWWRNWVVSVRIWCYFVTSVEFLLRMKGSQSLVKCDNSGEGPAVVSRFVSRTGDWHRRRIFLIFINCVSLAYIVLFGFWSCLQVFAVNVITGTTITFCCNWVYFWDLNCCSCLWFSFTSSLIKIDRQQKRLDNFQKQHS